MGQTGFRIHLDAWRRGLATQDEVQNALLREVTADPRSHAVVLSLIEAYRQAGHIPVPFAERLLTLDVARMATPPTEIVQRDMARGRILANQYVVEGLVPGGDRGGTGLVFKARDLIQEEALDRNPFVAIKIFNERFKREPQSMAALHREYKNALMLSHPNIVKLQNFNRDGADVFVVMELLEGRSLEHVITAARTGRPAPADGLRIVKALTHALAYAHDLGIVHSDFKPCNAFVTNDGTIKVLDFGFARAIKRAGDWSCYASSEQIGGASPDPRDDVYALAVVAYEVLTGSHPFERQDAVSAREAGLRPRSIQGLSRRQWRTIQSALAFSREQRPADAGAFGRGLQPKTWPVSLLLAGAVALAVVAAAISVLVSGWTERRAVERIAKDLDSPVAAVSDDAVKRLFEADETTRESVLSKEGAKKKVLTVYERQARSAFDPQQHAIDYAQAQAIIRRAKIVLPDYEPLGEYAESLSREHAHQGSLTAGHR